MAGCVETCVKGKQTHFGCWAFFVCACACVRVCGCARAYHSISLGVISQAEGCLSLLSFLPTYRPLPWKWAPISNHLETVMVDF